MAQANSADVALRRAAVAVEAIVREGIPHPDQGEVMERFRACAENPAVSKAILDALIRRFAAVAAPLDLVPGTVPTFACGLCIENGGACEPAIDVTLRLSKESVGYAARFHRAMRAQPEGGGIELPMEEWVAGNMYELLSPVLYNVLKRSPAARKAVRADGEFLADVTAFADCGECPEGWVVRVLRETP